MNFRDYANENYESVLKVIRDLCAIPAPSHFEDERAEYCKRFLEENGAVGVYIDEAKNVIYPLGCEGSGEITVIAAHTDTVFPDREPMPLTEDDEKIYCPGVYDDTAEVAVLLHTAVYFAKYAAKNKGGLLFVCNSCEEGLGNLKGTRAIMSAYEGRIKQFISYDCTGGIVDRAVGSSRFEVEFKTEGGHSFSNFGNTNAIAVMADIITKIYSVEVPKIENTKTTYNVGIVSGGTSVNTIAQNAKMLCEYRSDSAECLEIMKNKFVEIFSLGYDAEIAVRIVGERPCGRNVDGIEQEKLDKICESATESVLGYTPERKSGSTDCNIPLSLGIPSACVGIVFGGGAHTREEWLEKSSLLGGLELSLLIASSL